MGLVFLGDEREDFGAMIEEVAQRVENLGLGDAQVLGDLDDRFAAPVQRSNMACGNSEPVNDVLASANAIEPNDVGMLRLDGLGHPFEANSQALSDLMASVATAASQPRVSVVSMSWGFAEGQAVFASDEATYDSVFTTPGVTFVASTGD